MRMICLPGLTAAALVAAGLCILAVPVAAAGTLYDCAFEQMRSRGGGWIPERLVLVHDPATGKVEVLDPIIKYYVGTAIEGAVSSETGQRIGFAWTLRTKDSANQTYPMFYRFTFYKDGRPAQMRAQPGGYDNSWSGSGTCKLGKS